jgi:hypothetical protein
MSGTKQSKGTCAYCGHETTKGAMTRHLAICAKRQEAIAQAEHRKSEPEGLYHLRVQDANVRDFWLDLEIRGSATLTHLDDYLRAIWLECCGHLSEFSVGGWGGTKVAMRRRADQAFQPGVELTHIYDFGTESVTRIKMVAVREGKPTTSRPIALLARNVMPQYKCIECGQPATWLCLECLTEDEVWGTLCDQHAKTHPHEDYGDPIKLVNSPRLGMCGYTGPAEPPY